LLDEQIARQIHVALVGALAEQVQHGARSAPRIIQRVTELAADAVGGEKADATHFFGDSIWLLAHDPHGVGFVAAHDALAERVADAQAVQKREHLRIGRV
jgi:hypothetical protein